MKSYINLYKENYGYFSDLLYAERYFSKTKGKILEIGCSIGHHMKYFSDRRIGLDIDLDALLIAKKTGYNVIQADLNTILPFKNNIFEAIECQQVIEHLKNPLKFMEECYRILKKEGFIVLVTPDIMKFKFKFYWDYTHIQPFTKRSLMQLAYDSGFNLVKIENFYKSIPLIKRFYFKNIISLSTIIKLQNFLYSLGYRYKEQIVLVATK